MAGSMSYHMEARLKQDRINRWNEQKRHAEVTHQGLEEKHEDVAFRQKMGKVLSSDPGQFNQIRSVHSWTGTERNRRFYDYSCKGPLLGSSWRELRRELNFREQCLSASTTVPCGVFKRK
ncbi:uncharacterized protein LOC143292512 isoform X2 [Babylonia areolata]|uniref:uncharacterized protein LOC143292512 isoform X2 n=1 Tax=Babylonia areolata TaxID=304850 RepID=UPI003FD07BCB